MNFHEQLVCRPQEIGVHVYDYIAEHKDYFYEVYHVLRTAATPHSPK